MRTNTRIAQVVHFDGTLDKNGKGWWLEQLNTDGGGAQADGPTPFTPTGTPARTQPGGASVPHSPYAATPSVYGSVPTSPANRFA